MRGDHYLIFVSHMRGGGAREPMCTQGAPHLFSGEAMVKLTFDRGVRLKEFSYFHTIIWWKKRSLANGKFF